MEEEYKGYTYLMLEHGAVDQPYKGNRVESTKHCGPGQGKAGRHSLSPVWPLVSIHHPYQLLVAVRAVRMMG
jgi:hypothetical protein